MYLLVFIFLLMSVLGVYVEVFSFQTANIFANQTAIGETMLVWHNAVYAFAKKNGPSLVPPTTGCYLTSGLTPACTLLFDTSYLPSGYQTGNYSWASLAYASGTAKYLVTYTAVTTGGFTTAEIMNQVRKSGVPPISYGLVTCASGTCTLTTSARSSLSPFGQITYTVPTAVPNGAVAFISAI